MNTIRLRILSKTNGESKLFTSVGEERTKDGKTVLLYRQDQSSVTLSLQEDFVTMERQGGGCYLYLTFEQGKKTVGFVGMDRLTKGEIYIQTNTLKMEQTKSGAQLYLEYTIVEQGDDQRVSLRLMTEYI